MNILFITIILIILCLIGFTVGRYADKYLGHMEKIWIFPVPHHWIWGMLFMMIGTLCHEKFWGICSLFFGIGLFISDLKDFLNRRFLGEEPPHEWKFWSID